MKPSHATLRTTEPRALVRLARELVRCTACPRLVAHREEVGRTKRRAYREETYWARPVPGFGDPTATIVIVGLAPGAHGANRTGRVFTGDRSGDFLYAALHRAGLASQPTSTSKRDGLALRDVWITLAARCVPPDNHPRPDEVTRCGEAWLDREIELVHHARVVLALGAIAWNAWLDHHARVTGSPRIARARATFKHGEKITLSSKCVLLGSYHVSQQNTQTGRLTNAMFDAILREAIRLAR